MDLRLRLALRLRFLGLLVVLISCGFVPNAVANPVSRKPDAHKLFDADCAVCHGPNGQSNTPVGESLKAPDLRSKAVQKLADVTLLQVINNGKGIGMPSFKNRLNKSQIENLVAYVRHLAGAKEVGRSSATAAAPSRARHSAKTK